MALGEEFCVPSVKIEKRLGYELALAFIGLQNRAVSEAAFNVVELPGKVDGIVESGVHSLAGFWGMYMTAVSAHENAVIERVLFGDSLPNGID